MNNIELKLNISFEEYHDHFGRCECHEQELREKFSEADAMLVEGGDEVIILQKYGQFVFKKLYSLRGELEYSRSSAALRYYRHDAISFLEDWIWFLGEVLDRFQDAVSNSKREEAKSELKNIMLVILDISKHLTRAYRIEISEIEPKKSAEEDSLAGSKISSEIDKPTN